MNRMMLGMVALAWMGLVSGPGLAVASSPVAPSFPIAASRPGATLPPDAASTSSST